jgi:hypothetical protein
MRWMRIRALHWGQVRLTSPVPKIVSIFDMCASQESRRGAWPAFGAPYPRAICTSIVVAITVAAAAASGPKTNA